MRGHQRNYPQYNKNPSKTNHSLDVNFILMSKDTYGLQIPYSLVTQKIRTIIKDHGKGAWSYQKKYWCLPREHYMQVYSQLKDYFEDNKQKQVKLLQIQDFVFKAEDALFKQTQQIEVRIKNTFEVHTINYNKIQTSIQPETVPFFQKLFQFQKQSLKFGIQRHGRMLLADEMGVGKTIQSLAVAYIYKHEWPMLVICPPSLKLNWKQQIQHWYPKKTTIQLINSGKAYIRKQVDILIVSYDLAWRAIQIFSDIRVVIADQAHYLKSQESKRSQILVPFLSSRKRVLLLTGTPAFARPKQIYNLVSIVRPDVFKNFKSFGNRYCDPRFNQWSGKYEYVGCKNTLQLHYLLKNTVMIRRLKQQVLKQLPDKNRQKVIVETDPKIAKQIQAILQNSKGEKLQTFFQEMGLHKSSSHTEQFSQTRQDIMLAYVKSGQAKIKAIKQYITQILQNNVKILVFAHHQKVLNQLEDEVKKQKRGFIRIDGNVPLQQRHENVQKFQKDPNIMVALLSITAAGVGLTLTAASTVIFAQLHWTPALMIQAQDRAHRVGQKSSVNCHYLIGQNTLDEILYNYLERKIQNVSSFIDGKAKDFESEALQKGEKGKFSKKQQTTSTSTHNHFNFQSIMPIISKNQLPDDSSAFSQVTDISQESQFKSIYQKQDKISRKKQPQITDYFKQKPKIMMSVLKEQDNIEVDQYRQTEVKQRIEATYKEYLQQSNKKNQNQEQFEDQFFQELVKAIKSKKDSSKKSNQSNQSSNSGGTQTLSIKTTKTL